MSARDVYLDAMQAYDLPGHWHPLWEPASPIEIGAVGDLNDIGDGRVEWNRRSDLASHGVNLPSERSVGPMHSDNYASGSGVDIEAGLQGSTDTKWQFIGSAKAGFIFKFAAQDLVAIVAPDAQYEMVRDEDKLGADLVDGFNHGHLKLHDVIVTGVLRASTGAVMVSSSTDSEVKATSEVTVTPGKIDVAKVTGDINIVDRHNMSLAENYPNGLVLAFKALKIVEKGLLFLTIETRPAIVEDPSLYLTRFESAAPAGGSS